MRIQLFYFAAVREVIGRSDDLRAVPDGITASGLFDLLIAEFPRLAPMRSATMMMVNQTYVPSSTIIHDGDEVALIPPVSGGTSTRAGLFRIQSEPLDPREVERAVLGPASGAVVTFVGTVRDRARGREVIALEYEAYAPAAEKMMVQIAGEITERWGIRDVAIVHRIGRLIVGEASVAMAVASPHREAAFAACQYAIERLKQIVPIWKKEFYGDGAVWVGSEATYQSETGRAESTITD